MSGSEEENSLETLRSQQSKEKKDLQGQITSLKHSVNKNDKKRKKEVQAIIEGWEKELKEKHEKELAMAKLVRKLSDSSLISSVNDENKNLLMESETATKAKTTRAQLRRNKKAEQAQKRINAMLEHEKNAGISQGKMETDAIYNVLRTRNLRLYEIAPDGDCLFNSLSYQINKGREISGAQLRAIAAKHIREHRDELLSFITDENGKPMDEFGFDEYCAKVEKTCAQGGIWGGEVELRAISSALRRPIEVVQPDCRSLLFGERFNSPPLIVTYHRFAYMLGEHYNSTVIMPVASAVDVLDDDDND